MAFLEYQGLFQATGDTGRDELTLVIERIDRVIAQIDDEGETLQPVAFAFGALINTGSFGGAETAPRLTNHYQRAHEVTWRTLYGVKEDLNAFREACIAAKEQIRDADDSAAQQMRTVTNALDVIAVHGQGDESHRAHQDARQNQQLDGGTD